MPEEVEILWKGCQEEHGLTTSPNRLAVWTLKSLLSFLECEDVVMAMECKCGWDTLLCVDTHHYAVGLLAREMCHVSTRLCASIALHLLQLLSAQELCWDLLAMAFLVEDDIKVQLLSIRLFQGLMEYCTEKSEKILENPVHQSLVPLFFHCHNENPCVAEASWEMLHCAAKFLKMRDLKKLVEEKLWKFAKYLLAEDRSRATEHLRQALPYLQRPQESLQETAVRFMGPLLASILMCMQDCCKAQLGLSGTEAAVSCPCSTP
ncbi:hypothetical protein TURU_101859 [Turdus rufiventris]|nr:hypothetical protein TURU_101859 [Turdus rufiventris]